MGSFANVSKNCILTTVSHDNSKRVFIQSTVSRCGSKIALRKKHSLFLEIITRKGILKKNCEKNKANTN